MPSSALGFFYERRQAADQHCCKSGLALCPLAEVMGHNWKAFNTCDALYSEQEYSPAVTRLRIILKTVLYVIK
jgi:hypothetical protein